MNFDFKNEVHRKIFINSASLIIAIVAYLLLSRMNDIGKFFGRIAGILMPFILGFGIAFLLNGPIIWLENRLRQTKIKRSSIRVLSTATIFLIAILFILFSFSVIIPSLTDSIMTFMESFTEYTARLENWIVSIAQKMNLDVSAVYSTLNKINIAGMFNSFFQAFMGKIMSYSMDFFHGMANLIIAFAAAFYMMMDKENLLHLSKTLVYSVLNKDRANFLTLYSMDARNVFQQYIVGNIIDSLIVGIVCWLGMLILNLPYAPMIGFIVGVTNIIPVFGPFLGGIPACFLLFLIKPVYALIFAIFILILQQVDGNVLKPIILGDKLGISGFWILFSVTVGGSIGGIPGMFLGVPIFALVYEAVKDLVAIALHKKHLTIPEEAGMIE